MKRVGKFIVLAICLLVAVAAALYCGGVINCMKHTAKTVELNGNWSFSFDDRWLDAHVPGCIHLDLLDNKLIPNPFWGTNEDSVAWVAEKEWTYRTNFNKSQLKGYDNVSLVFYGLDTYSQVFLNGSLLGETDNMFIRWEFPIETESLKDGENELIVKFFPSRKIEQLKAAENGFPLPELYAFSRKAPYQYGWDWGPKLTTCGIWQPVRFELWNDFKITDLQIFQNSLSDSLANVTFQVRILSDCNTTADVVCRINGKKVNTGKINLSSGINNFIVKCDIENPIRWWPNGLGKQTMYDAEVVVSDKKHKDKGLSRFGLRTIELSREKDSVGSEFKFIVNGVPVFMKGANYIPPESFITRMTDERYRELIQDCKDANMNMLRIWGGGQYENDFFYRCCDEAGILVWQDFMFCGSLYPTDSAMLKSVKEEAVYQICRLRNHPCIALWCGNNEVKNGWEDWGWKNSYTDTQCDSLSAGYDIIFKQILPNMVNLFDKGRPYVHTSPEWGWGHPECVTDGDSHYWGVWWGEQPFEVWSEKTGRFMSEYGFQSYPQLSTIQSFTNVEDRYVGSATMNKHQKHVRGTKIINDMMDKYFGIPDGFDNYLYVSQLTQTYGIGNALEIHRMKMPYCMGTLFWQLNDCWPVVSWSSVDYYGNWKALQYKAKKVFEPLIIATEMHHDSVYIYLVSDLLEDTIGTVDINICNFSGEVLRHDMVGNRVAQANTSSLVVIYPIRTDLMAHKDDIYVHISYLNDNKTITDKILYLDYPKNLSLPQPHVNVEIMPDGEICNIDITARTFVKDLYIYTDPYVKGRFSDNYFDMEPDAKKKIVFIPSEGQHFDKVSFKVKAYNSINNDSGEGVK